MGEVLGYGQADLPVDFLGVTTRAYALLPAAKLVPSTVSGADPGPGDGAAWLDRELRVGVSVVDTAPFYRRVPHPLDSVDINYGRDAIPTDAAFRGPITSLYLSLRESTTALARRRHIVEGVIRWGPIDLQAIVHGFILHLRSTLLFIGGSEYGDSSGQGGAY